MLRRLIGEDIELRRPSLAPRPGRGQGRPRADRAGAHEPGRQRPRRHAAGRHAHHRDRATSTLDGPATGAAADCAPGAYVMLDRARHRRAAWTPTTSGAPLRAVLHDQGAGQGHRARPRRRCTASSSRAAGDICASTASRARARRSRSTCPRAGEAAPALRRGAPGARRLPRGHRDGPAGRGRTTGVRELVARASCARTATGRSRPRADEALRSRRAAPRAASTCCSPTS